MILALLEGRKSMTRRLAVRQRDNVHENMGYAPTSWQKVNPGDRLYVRENFWMFGPTPKYAADGIYTPAGFKDIKITPSIHMPRWASRLTLVVTAVKVEQLQDINEADARAEGALWHDGHGVGHSGYRHDPSDGVVFDSATNSFRRLWSRLHGADSWAANPDVVALSFRVHRCNIDRMGI